MMFSAGMFSPSSVSGVDGEICSGARVELGNLPDSTMVSYAMNDQHDPQKAKKKRNPPGNPDPGAEVIALSPRTLLATNRFVCEVCNKGFQRDQNLQLHRRGHNLPWKLKQKSGKEARKKVYVCPDPGCIHHHPSRALGDLTGIKKHFCRKHGEKKWKCEKCSKVYAVQSDWKAHSKTCGTKEYRCDCGTVFSRLDNFNSHKILCGALHEESPNIIPTPTQPAPTLHFSHPPLPQPPPPPSTTSAIYRRFPTLWSFPQMPNDIIGNPQSYQTHINPFSPYHTNFNAAMLPTMFQVGTSSVPPPSATALLQKAASVGASGHVSSRMANLDRQEPAIRQNNTTMLTRDFLGLIKQCSGSEDRSGSDDGKVMEFQAQFEYGNRN